MNDDWLMKRAQKIAYGEIAQKPLEPPKFHTITEISAERKTEKDLEAIAPKTGYPELDYLIKGFVPCHLYTLTGETNVGKTSLACNFADRVRKQGKRVLYFALEPENTVVDYLASVRLDKRFDELTQEDTEYDDGMIHVYGKADVSKVEDLVKIIKESEIKYDLIIIDHIGYFIRSLSGTIQEQSNVIKTLAGLAKEKKTAIMIIAHLRKRMSNQKTDYIPTPDDISGSGSFKQDSTEVMIVVRQMAGEEGKTFQYLKDGNLYVVKTKCGPNGVVPIIFSERKANIITSGEMLKREISKMKNESVALSYEKPADMPF
jgi:replicative DNA helicase